MPSKEVFNYGYVLSAGLDADILKGKVFSNREALVQLHPQNLGVIVNWIKISVSDQRRIKLHFQAETSHLLFWERIKHLAVILLLSEWKLVMLGSTLNLVLQWCLTVVQGRRIPVCRWLLESALVLQYFLGFRHAYWRIGRPKAILDTQDINGKILTCFPFLAAFLAHKDNFTVGRNNQTGKEEAMCHFSWYF